MPGDTVLASDSATVGALMEAKDHAAWIPRLTVAKYDDDATNWVAQRLGVLKPLGADFELAKVAPYETVEHEGNILTTAGLQRLMNLLIGAGGQALTATAGRIGVGNSSTAATVGQTDLSAAAGSTNRWFQPFDATYPTAVGGLLTMRSTFATGDANFVWAEVGTDIGTPTVTASATVNATLLNRFVSALGTKASGSWVLTETITIA